MIKIFSETNAPSLTVPPAVSTVLMFFLYKYPYAGFRRRSKMEKINVNHYNIHDELLIWCEMSSSKYEFLLFYMS